MVIERIYFRPAVVGYHKLSHVAVSYLLFDVSGDVSQGSDFGLVIYEKAVGASARLKTENVLRL